MKYSKAIVTVLLFTGMTLSLKGQVVLSKSFLNAYQLTQQSTVKISNKYGDVMVTNRDDDSVSIAVKVTVTEKKEKDAIEKLDKIDVKFTATPYFVDVETAFLQSKTFFGVDWSDVTGDIFGSSQKVEIEYQVSIPVWANLEIVNKYGNVYTADHTGSFKLNISNGDFKAGGLQGETTLVMSFCNSTINNLSSARLDAGYSELILKRTGKLNVEGRSSKYWISNAEQLSIDSKRDKFYIDTLSILSGVAEFSLIQVAYLGHTASLNTKYGDLKVAHSSDGLQSVQLNSEYTDIIIGLPASLNYSLAADYRKTTFSLPPDSGFKTQLLDEKAQQYQVSGNASIASDPSATIIINALAGSVSLIRK